MTIDRQQSSLLSAFHMCSLLVSSFSGNTEARKKPDAYYKAADSGKKIKDLGAEIMTHV